MKIIVAISGASGAVLGRRLVEFLKSDENRKKYEVHLIISEAAKEIACFEETDLSEAEKLSDHTYDEDDLKACIASSSYGADAMIVMPCSMKTLSGIANGYCNNLINRAAENMLKTGRPLIISPRDTPFSLSALRNMTKLKEEGALIVPPVMAYYYKPKTIDDATCFFVGKVLDCLRIEHSLYGKWIGEK